MHPHTRPITDTVALHPDVERVALLGFHCYPTVPRSRLACAKGLQASASCDLDQLAAWQHRWPDCGWRAVCGPSGIMGLDVDMPGEDHKADGRASLTKLVQQHGPLPPRPMVRTGGGGWLCLFSHRGESLIGEGGKLAPGLDPLRGAQPITLPPSLHHRTGEPYRWIIPPWELSPPPIPPWLAKLLAPPPPPPLPAWQKRGLRPDEEWMQRRLSSALDRVRAAGPGSRNNTLNKEAFGVARWVAAGALSEGEAVQRLWIAARHSGLEDRCVRDTIRSAFRAGYQQPHQIREGDKA